MKIKTQYDFEKQKEKMAILKEFCSELKSKSDDAKYKKEYLRYVRDTEEFKTEANREDKERA